MRITGYKTYAFSLGLFALGVILLNLSGAATWADPSGDYRAAVGRLLGWLCIILACVTASIRHAITSLERKIDRILKGLRSLEH